MDQTPFNDVVASVNHKASGAGYIFTIDIESRYIPVVTVQHKQLSGTSGDNHASLRRQRFSGFFISGGGVWNGKRTVGSFQHIYGSPRYDFPDCRVNAHRIFSRSVPVIGPVG